MLPAPDPTDPESLFRAAMTMASILQFIWPLPDKGLHKRLYRVKAPTLVVWGAAGRPRPPGLRRRVRRRPSPMPALEVIDGAGHLPQLEQAEQTIGAVTSFLA